MIYRVDLEKMIEILGESFDLGYQGEKQDFEKFVSEKIKEICNSEMEYKIYNESELKGLPLGTKLYNIAAGMGVITSNCVFDGLTVLFPEGEFTFKNQNKYPFNKPMRVIKNA